MSRDESDDDGVDYFGFSSYPTFNGTCLVLTVIGFLAHSDLFSQIRDGFEVVLVLLFLSHPAQPRLYF